ncbi:MAG: lipoprotein signal peptidase [Flavobacteriaceae bacterium]|nr:lipoprotein signal peptidase [Flavobacteriaceae bacterium]|tara:strand:- start:5250 stop:5879 length:630 start_codon:yes stop_codon:yes gene_type:complete
MTLRKLSWIVLAILAADQALKVYIKLNYSLTYYGNGPIVDWDWFRLLFVENKGMAWGASLSDFLPFISEDTAKLLLSIFRLLAVTGIGIWLSRAIKAKAPKMQLIAVGLIFAGALGNIIDSVFYGVLFSETTYNQLATFLPEEGGYAPLMFGYVVDMFQFPMFTWIWPSWLPIVGGNQFTFFEPVFNIADSAISVGVVLLLLQQRKAAD